MKPAICKSAWGHQKNTLIMQRVFTGWLGIVLLLNWNAACAQHSVYAFEPVGFEHVRVDDSFWKPRMDKVATVTLPACIDYTEYKTPRIRNFEIAAGKR